jgi:hypothetical protein
MPAGDAPIVNVDRRKISIETKRMLEQMRGLQFRQGLVIDLRLSDDAGQLGERRLARQSRDKACEGSSAERPASRRVEVETIFGEVFEADAVVIAVGLSLGGSIAVGREVVNGGRYGEPSSEELLQALERRGAEMREVQLDVGGRISGRHLAEAGWLSGHADVKGAGEGQTDVAGLMEEVLVPGLREPSGVYWPSGYPPAPHWQPELTWDRMIVEHRAVGPGGTPSLPALSPDGAATFEMYVAPDGALAEEMALTPDKDAAAIASRMPLTVRGMVVKGLGEAGRVHVRGRPEAVWVVGRASGAPDYAASLASGVQAAAEIATVVCASRMSDGAQQQHARAQRGDDGRESDHVRLNDDTQETSDTLEMGDTREYPPKGEGR